MSTFLRFSRAPLEIAVVAAVLSAACGGNGIIYDNWGPPAGYAVLVGAVRHADGSPVGAAEVRYHDCEWPVGGLLAVDTTDAAGGYHVVAELPPAGALLPGVADTLHLRCDVFVGRGGPALDSVRVRFAPTRAAAPTTSVDLTVP